jgi:hypothetical protein
VYGVAGIRRNADVSSAGIRPPRRAPSDLFGVAGPVGNHGAIHGSDEGSGEESGSVKKASRALCALPSPGNVVGAPGWCGAILSHLCAFNGQAGEHWRWSDDGDYSDDG